jgi:hypothetical protein
MQETNEKKALFGTIALRRLLSQNNDPPIQQVIDSGLIPQMLT